jgi:transposase
MSLKLSMARRKLTIAERWQAIGMSNTGISSRNIALQFNVNHTVIGRLIQRYHQTGTVNDRPRSGRPRLTFPREDRRILAFFYRYPNKKTDFKLMQYNEKHIFLNLCGA